MRLDDLKKEGIPEKIIAIWKKRQGESLLPVQIKAIRKGLLSSLKREPADPVRRNMLITAPTSAGKSFCAEMAAVKALTVRQKTVMLFPLKSLAEQKYKLLQETYTDLGLKCLIVSGDHPENDFAFANGDYHIALVIYEKFDLALTASMDRLKNIALIVVDEIQTIAEPQRGAILERLLTKILASLYNPTIIALSAVIGWEESGSLLLESCSAGNGQSNRALNSIGEIHAEKLADWLRAVLVEETVRPVDLVRGVAAEGSYCYRSYNNHLDGSEPFVKIEPGDNFFDAFIRQIKADSGSTLIFLKSRMETVDSAFKMASQVNWKPAEKALAKLANEEPSFLIRSLKQAMSRGVAFHNSDLSFKQRAIVEQAFIDEEVKALFSTTTLAMGVNLPADTVYLETVKYSSGNYNSRPSLVPVSRAEFDNMAGRAGRLGMNKKNKPGEPERPGRAIILAESDFERDILWENYIASGKSTPLKSAFMSVPLADWALDIIVSGLVHTKGGLEKVCGCTLYEASRSYYKSEDKEPVDFDYSLNFLAENRFISFDSSSGSLSPLPLGKVVAQTGLPLREAVYYLKKMAVSQPQPENFPGMLALALSGSGYNLPPAILSHAELTDSSPQKMLYRRYDHLLSDVAFLLGESYQNRPLSYRETASLKAFLLLHDWSENLPVEKMEERYQVHLGQILSLGESAAYLLKSIGRLIEVTENDKNICERTNGYAYSLRFGLPIKWKSARSCFKDILNRSDYLTFEQSGIESLDDIVELSAERLNKIIENKCKLKQFNEKLESFKEEVAMQTNSIALNPNSKQAPVITANEPETVEIDGSYERERYLVKINGFPVRLTGKSFKYFLKLAWSRLYTDSGWIYKEDIEIGFNQARYLYRMKNEVSSGINMNWPIVENNRLGYYRLAADPSKVTINFENLKDHPDYEIKQIVEQQINQKVN